MLGYTGASSKEDLENVAEGRDIEMGDAVGKAGIEQSYDDVLAGDHGQRTFITDASGEIQQVVSESDPAKGNDIYLTIAASVQYVADTALRELVQGGTGTAASLVCIDVKTAACSPWRTIRPMSLNTSSVASRKTCGMLTKPKNLTIRS